MSYESMCISSLERPREEKNKKNEEEIIYNGVKTMPLIIGNEIFERLATIGTSYNLLVYLTTVFHMKSLTATTLVNIFNGTSNFATVPIAFLCDTFFGRYKTLGFASISSFLGMVILTLTAAIPNFHPPFCERRTIYRTIFTIPSTCIGPGLWQLTFLLAGLTLLVIGSSGIRPCNQAFGADQFNPNTESGKKCITSFFNWYYFSLMFAMMVSLTVIVYVQSEWSWTYGLAICSLLMLLSCIFFFAGTRMYVKVMPDGSPLTSVVKVITSAFKKRRMRSLERPWDLLFNYIAPGSYNSKLPYTDQFRFLDKAATIELGDVINEDGSAGNPWRLCTMQQVEEVKCLMTVIPIWSSLIIYYVAIAQQSTYLVLQADKNLIYIGIPIPAGSFAVFSMLALTLWIPIYDRALVPILRKLTRKQSGVTILQRIGFGMVIAVLSMVLSGMVEAKRRTMALSGLLEADPRKKVNRYLSGMWFLPQLILMGISEAFTIIGHAEFYYKQFPENMRSIGASFLFTGIGLSSYLSGFLVQIVHHLSFKSGDWLSEDLNEGKLDLFYYIIAVMGSVNFVYFLVVSRRCIYKETSRNSSLIDLK